MFGLGTWEILMILIVALVFIGPSKLPSLARSMGKGMRDMRRAMAGFEDEVRQASTIPEPNTPQSQNTDEDTLEEPAHRVPRAEARHANAPPHLHDEQGGGEVSGELETEGSKADRQHG